MLDAITLLDEPRHVDFYFDVLCPFAWRTSLWMRDVRCMRSLSVTWRQFSLAIVNKAEPESEFMQRDLTLGRLFIAAERLGGNEAVDGLYLALGDAIHGLQRNATDHATLRGALESAGLGSDLLETAMNDQTTELDYRSSHEQGVAHGAFGVPTLVFEGRPLGQFGPVLDPVPTGEDALDVWRMTLWMAERPYLWELKKSRVGHKAAPLRAPGAAVA